MTDATMTIFVRDPNILEALATEYSHMGCSSVWNTARHEITVTRS